MWSHESGEKMEKRRELTKTLLAESFKELLLKRSFDKITIKMITDAAGVIRPTFYNYFQDKYEVMEWLLETEIFCPVREMIGNGMEREAIYLILKKMEKDREYYQKAFEVTGQNGFEEILTRNVREMLEHLLEKHKLKIKQYSGQEGVEIFLEYHTMVVVNGLKLWLQNKNVKLTADEAMDFYVFLISQAILDLLD